MANIPIRAGFIPSGIRVLGAIRPYKMAEGTFTISYNVAEEAMYFNLLTPPQSTGELLNYFLFVDGALEPPIHLDVDPTPNEDLPGDDLLPRKIPFSPLNYSKWPFGGGDFSLSIRVAAVSTHGVGPSSDPVSVNIDNKYTIDSGQWSAAEITSASPAGRRRITVNGAFVVPAGYEIRAYSGTAHPNVGTNSAVIRTIQGTRKVEPGVDFNTSGVLTIGSTAYNELYFRRLADDAWFLASENIVSFDIVGLTGTPLPPVIVAPPVFTGNGQIGTRLTMSGYTITGATIPHVFGWRRDGVIISGQTNDYYDVVAADDRKLIQGTLIASNGTDTVGTSTPAVEARYPPPAAIAPLANVTYDEDTGNKTVNAAAAFSGSAIVYSISPSDIFGINPTTGAITIPTEIARPSTAFTVTAANSGGSVTRAFTVTITAAPVLPAFPATIANSLWTSAEVLSAPEGRRTATLNASVSIPSGFTLHIYQNSTNGGSFDPDVPTIAPGGSYTTTNSMAVGDVCYAVLYWQRTADGAHQTASINQKSYTIVGIGGTNPGAFPVPPGAVLTAAAASPLIRYSNSVNAGSNIGWSGNCTMALIFHALSGSTTYDARILQQLRYWATPGNEPTCEGGYSAQHIMAHVVDTGLVKSKLPRIWSQLNGTEVNRLTASNKAALFASAWICSDTNPFVTGAASGGQRNLRGTALSRDWGANFRCAMDGMVVAALPFFGGTSQVKALLDNYNHSAFLSELSGLGLTAPYGNFNVKAANPSSAAPSATQIKTGLTNWKARGRAITQVEAIANWAVSGVFSRATHSGYGGNAGNGWIGPGIPSNPSRGKIMANAAGLPNKGEIGMLEEFQGADSGSSPRSSAMYSHKSMRIALNILGALLPTGYLDPSTTVMKALRTRCNVGMTDFDYKATNGYYSYANIGGTGSENYTLTLANNSYGWKWNKSYWFDVFNPFMLAND